MAAGIVPRKGEPTFCERPCSHKDCAFWREFFTSKCAICGEPFEEGQRYYQVEPGRSGENEQKWVHANCEEERIERVEGVTYDALTESQKQSIWEGDACGHPTNRPNTLEEAMKRRWLLDKDVVIGWTYSSAKGGN